MMNRISNIGLIKFIAVLVFVGIMVIRTGNAHYLWFMLMLPVIAIFDLFKQTFLLEYAIDEEELDNDGE